MTLKICQLRVKNLNSLAGSWHIDFEALAAQQGGLFAITGPTGSGKSTLLDGICLALFGRTPRLKEVNSAQNEMMTRHSGDCMAEVTFEAVGKRYRVLWSQRRARGTSTGKLQPQRHELSLVDYQGVGKIIENKVSQVPVKIKELCGMDFEQFTRSVFLPQGGFAAFLSASSAERAELLEGLTGTVLYTQISQRVHELTREQSEELKSITARQEELHFLSEDQRNDLEKRICLFNEEAKRCKTAQEECHNDLLIWQQHRQIALLQTQSVEEKARLSLLEEAAETWFPRLEADHRAQSLIPLWEKVKQAEISLAEQDDRHRHQVIELKIIQEQLVETQKHLQTAAERQEKHRLCMEARLPLLAQVAQLDEELLMAEQNLRKQEVEAAQQEERFLRQKSTQIQEKARYEKRAEEARLWSSKVQLRKESAVYNLRQFWNQRIETWASLYNYRNKGAIPGLFDVKQGKAALEKAAIGHLRNTLIDGVPCPLCGALDHPADVNDTFEICEDDVFAKLTEEMDRHLKEQRYITARDELRDLIDAMGRSDEPNPKEVLYFWRNTQAQWEKDDEEMRKFELPDATLSDLEALAHEVGEEELKYQVMLQRQKDGVKALEERRLRRQTLFSGDVAEERAQLEKSRVALDQEKWSVSEALEKQGQQERLIFSEQTRLEGILAEGKASLHRQKQDFHLALKNQGFLSQQEWQSALLRQEERANLEARRCELDEQRNLLAEIQRDVHRRELETPPAPFTDHESLAFAVELHQHCSDKAHEIIGQSREALRLDDANKQRSTALKEALEVQRQRLKGWERLHELIGSSDGKKFRSFVQGLSFRSLVAQASSYLQDMQDRYELLPSQRDSLNLEVRDLWQANEIRSIQNLSGGETFMVSLALALALSGTGGIQETLFLDEGFGSLDDESLDLVLNALEKLRQKGRVIGVISHVAALRQRIPCQISLIQRRGGYSQLIGPGCSSKI